MPTWRGSLPALFALTEPRLQGRGFAYIGPNWFNTHMLGFRQPGGGRGRARDCSTWRR